MKYVIAAAALLVWPFHLCHGAFEADALSPLECALSLPGAAALPGLLPSANPASSFDGAELAFRRSYGLDELSVLSVGFGADWRGCTYSVCASQLGGDLYRETTSCLGVAHSASDKIRVGTRVKVLCLRVSDLSSEVAPELDIGILSWPLPGFSVGASVSNCLGTFTDSAGPTSSISMALDTEGARVTAGAIQSRPGVRTSVGCAIQVNGRAQFLAGISSNPSQTSFGLALNVGRFCLAIATEWHPELGLSESIGLRFPDGADSFF